VDYEIIYRKKKMAERLVFFIALLIILFSASGCPSGAPELAEPVGNAPNEVVSSDLEEKEVDTNDLKPKWATDFHEKCAGILSSFVNEQGMVDYKGLKQETLKLRELLEEFNNFDPNEYRSWLKEDRIAFWINAFNLHKLNIVLANYPIQASSRFLRVLWGPTDLRHIENKITGYKFLVMDEEFTFKRIEDRFFRGEFNDPRILLAITDACLSSPPLCKEPYYGYKLNEQLDDQARKFLSNLLAFRVDGQRQRVYLSAVFEAGRFGGEFLKKYAIDRKFKDHPPVTRAVLNFITGYVSEHDVSFLEKGSYSVKYMRYDWQINDGF
jgi:hypothetical protein